MASKRRNPPKHLKTNSHERMPARPNDRLENERQRQLNAPEEAEYSKERYEPKHQAEHSDYENVAETADNTKLFYDKLLPLAKTSHAKNKRFLRTGVMWLFALPVILYIIRNMTSGNKIAFLIAWIIGMFIIASALIIIAYQDEILQRNLDELQEYVPEVEGNQLGKLQIVSAEDLKMIAPGSMDAIVREAMAEREAFERQAAAIRSLRPERDTRLAMPEPELEEKPKTAADIQHMWQQLNDPSLDDRGGTNNE